MLNNNKIIIIITTVSRPWKGRRAPQQCLHGDVLFALLAPGPWPRVGRLDPIYFLARCRKGN